MVRLQRKFEDAKSDKLALKKIKNAILRDKGVQDMQRHIWSYTDWSNFKRLIQFIKNVDGVNAVYYKDSDSPFVQNGYRWRDGKMVGKDRDIEIETDYGTLKGSIMCAGAGTVEDPLSSYDMTLQIW